MKVRTFAFITSAVVRYAFRDRVAAVSILVLPFAIIALVGAIFSSGIDRSIGITIYDHGPWAERLVAQLLHDNGIKVDRYATLAQLKTAVREERVTAGLEIPANYDTALAGRGAANVKFIIERQQIVPTALRLAVYRNLTAIAAMGLAARYQTQLGHLAPSVATRRAISAASAGSPSLHVEQVSQPAAIASAGISYSAPGILVLFIFLNITMTGSGLVTIRQLGVTRRMLSTATGSWTIALSEAAGRVVLGLLQAAVIMVIGALAFDVHWGSIVLVFSIVFLAATVAATLALITSSISATPQQAFVLAPALMITASMLGGCLWPLAIVGSTMRFIGRLFPPAWAMDALLRLGVPGGGYHDVILDIGVLLAFAVVLTLIAVPVYRRKITAS